MYEMQPSLEDSVRADRVQTRRSLHAVPELVEPNRKREHVLEQPLTRRALHTSTREQARELPVTRTEVKLESRSSGSPSSRAQAISAASHTSTAPLMRPRREPQLFDIEEYEQSDAPTSTPALNNLPVHPNTMALDVAALVSPTDLTEVQATVPLELKEPTLDQLMWLEEMRYHLRSPSDPALDVNTLSHRFDEYCTAWHSHSRRHKWDHTFAVTSIGITLGDLLVAHSRHNKWVVSGSGETLTFAVRNNSRGATFFPIDAVARRWLAGTLEWIPGFIENATHGTGADGGCC